MIVATTFGGIPLSCAQDEYVRRNVSHVARRSPAACQAGQIHVRSTLFGEMDLPEPVANMRSSGPVRRARPRQSTSNCSAVSDNGIGLTLASVLGSSNVPS
jgi:hypothetical protein